MASSATEIVNSALAKLGASRIISLDDNSEQARLMRQQYPVVKLDLLGSHPWNFATKQVQLAASTTVPLLDFSTQYPLPVDCIRVLNADLPKEARWKVEGRFILCDFSGTLNIRYLSSNVLEGNFSPMFSEALAGRLAADVAYSITQSTTVVGLMEAKADRALRNARTFDAQESNGDRFYADSWLNSRL